MNNKIYQKLNNIENLNDRLLLKKVLNDLFTCVKEYSEKRYDSLEERVFKEIQYSEGNYNIFCTINKRQHLDPTSQFLYPILDEDIKEKAYDTSEILQNITKEKETTMFKVFLKCDYLIYKNIINNKKIFKGIIETDKRNYEGNFVLRKNTEYWNKIIELYRRFIDNNIPWATINNPYISKIADVILIQCQDGIEEDEKITKISIDFGEYSKFVEYDMVPLWNVKKLYLKSNGFPMPCQDNINYEHVISLKKEGTEHGYLAEYDSSNIKYVIRNKDSLIISAQEQEIQPWYIWKIIAPIQYKIEKYNYELMSNSKNSSFVEKLYLKNTTTVKTKAELIRIINSFEVSKYLEFQCVRLEDESNPADIETYNMNYFIFDEIREDNIKKVLVLYFKALDNNYFTRDILSFLVSEIQLFYPEYKCEGRLI